MRQRTRLVINAGNLLELLGAGCAVAGVCGLLGLWWALIVGAAVLIAAAELVYDEHPWRVPLPLRPQPRRWVTERRQRFGLWRMRRRARRAA